MKGIAVTPSIDEAKSMARRLRTVLAARGLTATHSDTLELVAAQLGYRDWNTASAALGPGEPGRARFTHSVPLLLSLDEAKCRAFYCGFLGFEVEFEHRFAPHMPVYLGLRRGPVQLHLSPHRGDATTGSAVFVWMTGIDAYRRELTARSEGHAVPEPAEQSWGRELTFTDPFGNRLRFCERPASEPVSVQGRGGEARSNGADDAGVAARFDVVREVGANLAGVRVTGDGFGTALRAGGDILACPAIHKSAEPHSLMVRVGLERRDALVAANPDAFYLTGHYQPHPVVLVRMARVERADLRRLLKEGWAFVQREQA